MSNNFVNNRVKKILNYRDVNQFIFELSYAIIKQNDTTTYYQDLENGQVLDNWGVDLYKSDNLQNEANKKGVEYFLTFNIDSENSEQINSCDFKIVCDFSLILSDCNPSKKGTSKQRVTRIVDLFIESILKNNLVFVAEIKTAVNSANQLTEKSVYSSPFLASKLVRRTNNIYETINSNNYLTCNFAIQFIIKKIS